MTQLEQLIRGNRFHTLGPHFYSETSPRGLTAPKLVRSSSHTTALLGLDASVISSNHFLDIFSGNSIPTKARPLAQDYAGHQFGQFNPFLGDGRSIVLGDAQTLEDCCEISLKGAGKTVYARQADGRAGITECLHEFEMSEKLKSLAIPTTRSLCVVTGKQKVHRGELEPEAILTRLAPTHIRFGTFENYYFQRNHDALRKLADHVMVHHYPQCLTENADRYQKFFKAVVIRTAHLIAHWQFHGFTHGVMNTDNQSIIGITLDQGASSFTQGKVPGYVSLVKDEHGRYAFGRQPEVGLWNCNVLAKALSPLISPKGLQLGLLCYESEFQKKLESLRNPE